ncbi:MAG: type I-U CRISPR-associated helicase/endonuclease Cas3, partial [Verrucomicrobiota bacterium]|nr:type I-U CRISPR-associated helicase/endonuclease Cas3 [Verrucomicrobiota bacterium]
MTTLSIDDFPSFFEALWGHPPFPWQNRLARLVAAQGWPKALDLPTASGKTAVLDIALFHLALEANKGAARTAPLRILHVVDRRLIVDDSYRRAQKIADKLAAPDHPVLHHVAEALRGLAGENEKPVNVVQLRGGMPKEPDWARTPCQPTIVSSTVDQVGSRLLFRGYGVSDRMKPVHAGLVGSDALFLLDEAHLSEPFRQTLESISRETRLNVVTLSATLGACDTPPFRLDEQDGADDRLIKRLNARKPAELIKCTHALK